MLPHNGKFAFVQRGCSLARSVSHFNVKLRRIVVKQGQYQRGVRGAGGERGKQASLRSYISL